MIRHIFRRVLESIPLFFLVLIINFSMVRLAPGSPISYLTEGGQALSAEYLEMLEHNLGLDRPIHEQLFQYLWGVFQGDLGYSYIYKRGVTGLILERIPATLLLVISAITLGLLIGIVLGVIAARRRNSLVDNFIRIISLTGYSIPTFWSGQMLLLLFALYWGVLPAGGIRELRFEITGIDYVVDVLSHMILPVFVLGLFYLTIIARLTRASMLEVLTENYITEARAKGLSERVVVWKHALKNTLLPVVTMAGLNVSMVFTGAVLTETVFSWPGLGRLLFDSLVKRDYPMIQGIFTVVAFFVITINLLTDIIYAFIDPRIRYGGA